MTFDPRGPRPASAEEQARQERHQRDAEANQRWAARRAREAAAKQEREKE